MVVFAQNPFAPAAYKPKTTVPQSPLFTSPYLNQPVTKPPRQLVAYTPPQPVGGGYSYSTPQNAYGFETGLEPQFGQIAQYIGQGTQQATDALRRAAEQTFTARAEGIAGGRNEELRRLGFESGSQGYSPELLRRMQFGLGADDQASIAGARGESMAGFETALAELLKGTGTELASLKHNELGMLMQAYLAAKGREAARKAGKNSLIGGIAGLAGSVAGGLAGNPGLFGGGGGGAYGGDTISGGLGGF